MCIVDGVGNGWFFGKVWKNGVDDVLLIGLGLLREQSVESKMKDVTGTKNADEWIFFLGSVNAVSVAAIDGKDFCVQ